MRFQQTRLQRQLIGAADQLERWAANPWRRLSLLLIVLLACFSLGGFLGTITGALSQLDPVAALVCVALVELAIRLRRPLLRARLALRLELLDAARLGLLYGLLLDGFKLL